MPIPQLRRDMPRDDVAVAVGRRVEADDVGRLVGMPLEPALPLDERLPPDVAAIQGYYTSRCRAIG